MANFDAVTVGWNLDRGNPPYLPGDIVLGETITESLTLVEIMASSRSLGRDFIVQVRFQVVTPNNPAIRVNEFNLLESDRSPAATIKNMNLVLRDDDLDNLSISDFLTGSDVIRGSQFRDIIRGLAGNDRINGGGGNDILRGDAGNDVIDGGSGKDNVIGGTGQDDLAGGDGDDHLQGEAGNDQLRGQAGNDTLDGGSGADRMTGGAGDDTYYVNSRSDQVIEGAGGGTDRIVSSIDIVLPNHVESLTLGGTRNLNGTGNDLDNSIFGNTGHNLLLGGAGDDRVVGGRGNDTLDGGSGDDQMSGGTGDDTYRVDSESDRVVESRRGGTDNVIASANFVLSDQVENLTLSGSSDLNGTGNDLDNTIFGNAGNNLLKGGDGADRLLGGGGNDDLRATAATIR